MNLRRLLGIRTQAERYDALPDAMSSDERNLICGIIRGFLSDEIGDHDWDWVMTGPKESKEAERISGFCAGIDFIFPAVEKHHFTSTSGEAALCGLLELIDNEDHSFQDVCRYIDTVNAKAEPAGAAQPATRSEVKAP